MLDKRQIKLNIFFISSVSIISYHTINSKAENNNHENINKNITIIPTIASTQNISTIPTISPISTVNVVTTLATVPTSTIIPTDTKIPILAITAIPIKTATLTVVPTPIKTVIPTVVPTPIKTATPTVVPTPIKTATPTVVPTPIKTATPTVVPTPIITQIPLAPAIKSKFLDLQEPLIINTINNIPKNIIKKEFMETTRDEQFALLPNNSNGLSGTQWVYQRRFNSFVNFAIFSKDTLKNQEFEVLNPSTYIFDSAVFCPMTEEYLILGPGIDAFGKSLKGSKPRRVYLYSPKTKKMELIWRMNKEMKGAIGDSVSATPDCKHVLVTLHLKTEKAKTPYGEIYVISQIINKWGEWHSVKIDDTPKNGITKNFGSISFIQPQNPLYYKSSSFAPQVVAIEDAVDPKYNFPKLYIYKSQGKSLIHWKKTKISIPHSIINLTDPLSTNKMDSIFFNLEKNELTKDNINKKGIGLLNLENNEFKEIIDADNLTIKKHHVNPDGNKIVFSFVKQSLNNTEKKQPLSGVLEINYTNEKPIFYILENLFYFANLTSNHDPRPTYSGDGRKLIYGVPEISDIFAEQNDEKITVDKSIQFPVKLLQIESK